MQIGFITFGEVSAASPDDIDIDVEMAFEVGFGPDVLIPGYVGTIDVAECPPCVLATSDGTLLVSTGIGPVQRLRQNERNLTNAGVPAPKDAPVIKSTRDMDGSGSIEATRTQHFSYTQYGRTKAVWAGSPVRTLAREVLSGRPSLKARQGDLYKYQNLAVNLPGEADYQKKLRLRALFLGNTAVQPGGLQTLRWDWDYLEFDLQVLDESGVNGSPGVGVYSGRYQAYMTYVDKDGNQSDPGPISEDSVLAAEPYVQYAELEVPDDPRVVRRQLWRNTNGQSDVFYLDVDTTDLTSTELRSHNTDGMLVLSTEAPFQDGDGFSLIYLYGEPPADKPFLAEYVSRVWFGGEREYDQGNVAVVNGSATVTGIGTAFNASMAGRQFVKGSGVHLVQSVDPDAQTLTIDPAFAGEDDPYGLYTLRPYRGDASEIVATSAGRFESMQADNRFSLPADNDDMTGFVTHAGSLLVLKKRHVYRLHAGADPKRDASILLAADRGCLTHRCAVAVGGVVFMLDRGGIHAFDGGPDPTHVSLPVADLFREEGESNIKLNFRRDPCHWHAVHQEEQGVIRWYVTMGGDVRPQHGLCLDYRRARLWVEQYPVPITCSTLSNAIAGRPILGAQDGELLTSDLGSLDFVPGIDATRLGVSAADAWSVTPDASPPADVDGTVPVPIAVVSGPGRGQVRVICGRAGDRLFLGGPWTTLPTADSVLQIGAVAYRAITGEFDLTERSEANQQQAVKLTWQPSAEPLKLFIKVLRDGTTYLRNAIFSNFGGIVSDKDNERYAKEADLTNAKGYGKINFDRSKDFDDAKHSTVQIELEGFSGGDRPRISDIDFIGAK